MSANPYETEKLKGVMVKENLTWRSTASDDRTNDHAGVRRLQFG